MKGLFFILGIWGGVMAIVAAIVAVIQILTAPSIEERRQVFYDWIKATSNTNLSFEEFENLRSKHMLPGQAAKPGQSTVIFMPVYR